MDEKYGPDWAKDHSDEFMSSFDIENPRFCVLGIVGADEVRSRWESGYQVLCRRWGIDDPSHYGFCISEYEEDGTRDWGMLQETWKIALEDLIKH